MSLAEGANIAVALVAVVVAVVSLYRTRLVEAEQLRQGRIMADLAAKQIVSLDEADARRHRAAVTANMVREAKGHAVYIENRGEAQAQNLTLEIVDCDRGPFIRGDYDAKFPVEVLQPGGTIRLTALITHGGPLTYKGRLRWTNPDGSAGSADVLLSA
jgi:hypothetical protein